MEKGERAVKSVISFVYTPLSLCFFERFIILNFWVGNGMLIHGLKMAGREIKLIFCAPFIMRGDSMVLLCLEIYGRT